MSHDEHFVMVLKVFPPSTAGAYLPGETVSGEVEIRNKEPETFKGF